MTHPLFMSTIREWREANNWALRHAAFMAMGELAEACTEVVADKELDTDVRSVAIATVSHDVM